MYTAGNKAEQIEQLKGLLTHMGKLIANPSRYPCCLEGEEGMAITQRARQKYLKKKKRQLGRLERQVRTS
mgnify:CR=1 FL=1